MLDPEKDALAYHSLENRMYYHEGIEKMVYGQVPEEPGADFRVSFTAMDGRLVSVMELDDRESVYQSSEADVVERWLTPGYRLTGKEEERAKEMTAEYFSDKNFLKETFRNLGTGEIGKSAVTGSGIVGIPEEEYREAVRMYHLAIKLDDAYAFSSGLVHALPFCDTILEKIPGDTFENYNNIRAQADLQSPAASAAGEVTGNVVEYWIGAELMKKIPGVNAAVGRSTANIAGDLILDTTLDTIPNAAGDAADGLGGEKIAVNAVKNMGKNLGYNMLGEGIGSLFHAAGKIENRGYAAADDAVEDVTGYLDDMGEGARALDDQLGSLKDKVKINQYQSAESVNDWWEARGYKSPYKEKTVVQNITLTEDTKFVRVYDGVNSNLEGGWVMRAEDIRGLTPKEIQAKFALEYEPKFIGEVELKAGDTIRLGEAGPNFGFDGGGIQIDLQQQWIGDFTELGKIEEWR